MSSLSHQFSISRLVAIQQETRRLLRAEFPFENVRTALELLDQLFDSKLRRLESYDEKTHPDVVSEECTLALRCVSTYYH